MSTRPHNSSISAKKIALPLLACILSFIATYVGVGMYKNSHTATPKPEIHISDTNSGHEAFSKTQPHITPTPSPSVETSSPPASQPSSNPRPPSDVNIREDYRPSFNHGVKTAQYQKYIVLHDTEVDASATAIINAWQSQGTFVAAHFIVQKDGTIVQAVPMDAIAHHAGFGDTGHNALYGVTDESRDDRRGTVPIGSWASDYGMNSYSIGIEMVHVSGTGYYPPEQLEAVDSLIAYIDSYYGFQSQIIDHKAWRSGNSDTSPEFAGYLANYKDHRTHD